MELSKHRFSGGLISLLRHAIWQLNINIPLQHLLLSIQNTNIKNLYMYIKVAILYSTTQSLTIITDLHALHS